MKTPSLDNVSLFLYLICRGLHVQAVEGEVHCADYGGKPVGVPWCRFPSWPGGCAAEQLWVSCRGTRYSWLAQAASRRQKGLLLCPDPAPEQVSAASHWQPWRLQVGDTHLKSFPPVNGRRWHFATHAFWNLGGWLSCWEYTSCCSNRDLL